MRHRKLNKKLGGYTSSHQRAMYSNMLAALVEHGRIETTHPRAKLLRIMAEKAVTRATSLGDLLLKDPAKLTVEDRARMVHAMRMVKRHMRRRQAVLDLFESWAPRFLGRAGGYTRIIRKGFRRGDGAPMVYLEFIDAPMPQKEGQAAPTTEKKGLLDRLRRTKDAG